jgi:LPS-assembly lipoprotein
MSSSDILFLRRRLVAGLAAGLGLAALAGCGFRPLYGTGADGPTSDRFAEIRVAPIPDRAGQILRNFLIRRLNPDGRPANPAYVLDVGLSERLQGLAITQEDVAERNNLFVTARYVLTDAATGGVLLSDSSTVITSFTILRDEVATLSAEQDARRRSLRRLSDTIRLQLALYFQDPEGYGGAREEEEPEDAAPEDGAGGDGAGEAGGEPAAPSVPGPAPAADERPRVAPDPPPPPVIPSE